MRRWEYGMRHEFVPLPRKKPDRIPPARFAVPRSCNPQDRWDSSATATALPACSMRPGARSSCGIPSLASSTTSCLFHRRSASSEGKGLWIWHAAVLCANAEDGRARQLLLEPV
uniref:Uncharacterized protein n=1 Tax=Hordeum vulgare subsp. vulgare TaxID=112509 RepID=A0A8I7BG55_HORVV